MRLFKKIEIENYKNIKFASLNRLKDFNIIIGPNNCGKTNILNFINLIKNMEIGDHPYKCKLCEEYRNSNNNEIQGLKLTCSTDDFYLKNHEENWISIKIDIDESEIEKIMPGVLKKQTDLTLGKKLKCLNKKQYIKMENINSTDLIGTHLSPLIHRDIINLVKNSILYPPKGLIQNYTENDFNQFIQRKNLSVSEIDKLLKIISKLIDSRIQDFKTLKKTNNRDGEYLFSAIRDQGSGVISIIQLIADIVSNETSKIILIDEPELGLNPHAKQELLKFLLKESENKQIFITTQDPTFVNPTLWGEKDVGLYLYSVYDDEFHQVNLEHTKEDPNIFAGYLPHTVSLKDVHIYLEGSSDVYIFQIWLEKFLKYKFKNRWWIYQNRIGIYHMSGSFYVHLLYTIPKHPYKCLLILDGDKKWETENICKKYNESFANVAKFKFCKTLNDVEPFFKNIDYINRELYQPVYCLKKRCIEKYLFPRFNCKHPPKRFYKKIDGPKNAEENRVPDEIWQLFNIIISGLK